MSACGNPAYNIGPTTAPTPVVSSCPVSQNTLHTACICVSTPLDISNLLPRTKRRLCRTSPATRPVPTALLIAVLMSPMITGAGAYAIRAVIVCVVIRTKLMCQRRLIRTDGSSASDMVEKSIVGISSVKPWLQTGVWRGSWQERTTAGCQITLRINAFKPKHHQYPIQLAFLVQKK